MWHLQNIWSLWRCCNVTIDAIPVSMADLHNVLLNIKKTIKRNWNFVQKKLLSKTGISSHAFSCDEAIYEVSKEISGGQWGNLTTWYSNREVSTLRKISFALLEKKWVELGSVWYLKTRHCMVPWKSKVTYNLSYF